MPVVLPFAATSDVKGGVTVAEVTMATPDIICLEVRDPPINRGFIAHIGDGSGSYSNYLNKANPFTGAPENVLPVGPDKTWLRFLDSVNGTYANRTGLSTAANYAASSLGGRTVTAVYLVSLPVSNGVGVAISALQASEKIVCKHLAFLKLDGALPQGGPYRLINSSGAFKTQTFTFNDKVTRSFSIRSTQVGHRPSDAGKIAYLVARIPGYGTEGAVDFVNTYALSEFKIIDASGTVVYTPPANSVNLRTGPTTLSLGMSLLWDYASTTLLPWTATAVTSANPCVITYTGGSGDPVNGNRVIVKGFGTGATGVFFASSKLETGGGIAQGLVIGDVNTGAKTFSLNKTTCTLALGGTVTNGDTLTVTFTSPNISGGTPVPISVTATGTSTLATLSTALSAAINANVPVTAIINPAASGNNVVMTFQISQQAVGMTIATSVSGSATETLTFPNSHGAVFTPGFDALDTSTASTPWASGSFSVGYDSMIYPVYAANNAATNVYELDYHAWTGASSGMYRVWVPGLGVSDPFEVSDAVWYKSSKVNLGGVYNQRTGMALDGKFGVLKPIDFRDGVTHSAIYKSTLPAFWTTEGNNSQAPWIPTANGGIQNTITIGGTVTNLDVLSLTFMSANIAGSPVTVSTTAASGNTTSTLAANLATAINGSAAGVTCQASAAGAVINFFHSGGAQSVIDLVITSGLSGGATETISIFNSPWVTSTLASFMWGGHRDAGDWDPYIKAHAFPAYCALDVYEHLRRLYGASAVATNYGVPKSSQVLDPVLYGPADSLPDVVHEVIWTIDWVRRGQNPDGSVPGAMFFDTGVSGSYQEASWISSSLPWVAAPDHVTTYYFAALAAKLAYNFNVAGLTTLGGLWQTAAVNAWNFADPIGTDTPAGTLDAYYLAAKNNAIAHEAAGWAAGTSYPLMKTNMAKSMTPAGASVRALAAGCLYKLTGDHATYGTILEGIASASAPFNGTAGMWEYCYAPDAIANQSANVTTYRTKFVTNATNIYAGASGSSGASLNLPYKGVAASTSGGGEPTPGRLIQAPEIIRACIVQKDLGNDYSSFIRTLHEHMNFTHGANQLGICHTNGLGVRNSVAALNVDAACASIPRSPGWTSYSYFITNPFQGGFGEFGDDKPINGIVEYPTGTHEADYGSSKVMTPFRRQLPSYESSVQNPNIIFIMEGTIEQTVWTTYFTNAFLANHDGTAPPP